MQTIEITLFARLAIRRGDREVARLPAKAEELLCYLLLRRGQAYTREALACELWADAPATQSKKYLRQCLWQLQQALEPTEAAGPPLLRLDHEWVALHPDAEIRVDALEFDQAFVAVRDRPGAALDPQEAAAAQAAAALYRGDLLAGWYHSWCLIERARYESMFFAMLDKLIDYCRAHRLFDQGIAYGMRLLRSDHTHEPTHRQLMRLYQLAGNRSMALRQFEQCAAMLAREFGIQPTEQTLALAEQIRAGQLEGERAERAPALVPAAEPEILATLLAELANLRRSVAQLQHELAQLKRASGA